MLAKLAYTFAEDSLEAGWAEMHSGTDPTGSPPATFDPARDTRKVSSASNVREGTVMENQGVQGSSPTLAGGGTKPTDVTQVFLTLTKLHRKPMTAFLDPVEDDDEIETSLPTIDPWGDENPPRCGRDNLDRIHIEGGDTLKRRLRDLLTEFEDVFSTELRTQPAKIPPMELTVDRKKWERQSNRRGPRIVSIAKQEELEKQINKMLEGNVIQSSDASYYSQVLLTPKSDGSIRFCIDFRNLNDATANIGGYIPNIREMLQRLGRARSKFFAVLDLTKGYYQAPLSLASIMFTAFICFMGLFMWLRVPMGLKGAPTYFQRMMVTIVLRGLVYLICEVYLDDIIVHGKTEDEFLDRLRKVFERLRSHNITLNPSKCRLGMAQTEYVGHVIDETGLSFSQQKMDEVSKCRRPVTQKELKQFLGLVNYFRDHIRDHSMIVKPLNDMIPGGAAYSRQATLRWKDNPAAAEAFVTIVKKISECPKLYFIDERLPITLATDASDYGIGAYLYQTTNESIEQPLAFISKRLAGAQLNWSTPEKECYAIFYSVKKLEYLIRDVHFTLHTDHKNLTYINEGGSPKVVRWKLAIQEFMFDIEYLEGEKNIVADHWSRTVDRPYDAESKEEKDDTTTYLMNLIGENFRIPDEIYKRISAVHNSNVGHMGVSQTLNRMERDGKGKIEPLMRSQVRQFIKQCPCCQKMSQIRFPILTHRFTTASYELGERIAADSIGPLPPDEYGNRYILVIIEQFSRLVQLYPIKDTSAEQALKGLVKWTCNFGIPAQILTDNGTQFVNGLITEFIKLTGCEHVRTMPYSSEENALVERANKEVVRHLRTIFFDKKIVDDWGWLYPLAERIMNSTVNESLNVSPSQIMFGNAVDLDRGLFVPIRTDEEKTMTLSTHMDKMLSAQAEFLKIAFHTQQKKDSHHMAMQGAVTEFPINSYVLRQYENKDHAPPSKISFEMEGSNAGGEFSWLEVYSSKLSDKRARRFSCTKS